MKKVIVMAALAVSLAGLSSCGSKAGKSFSQAKESIDSAAYIMGYQNGKGMKQALSRIIPGDSLDAAFVKQGLVDALNGDTTKMKMTEEEVNAFMMSFQQKIQAKAKAKHDKEMKENTEAGEKFLAENKTKEGVVELPSGLQYKITKEGNGAKATSPKDTVEVIYVGKTLDGKVFDQTADHNGAKTDKFALDYVIPGWTEGFQQMPEGSKFTLWIPGNLAYGERGAGEKIGPMQTLVFDCELVKVHPAKTK